MTKFDFPDTYNTITGKMRTGKCTVAEMVLAVKHHARLNYEKGWDTVVECYTDLEIQAIVMPVANTRAGALAEFSRQYRPSLGYRREIEATAF